MMWQRDWRSLQLPVAVTLHAMGWLRYSTLTSSLQVEVEYTGTDKFNNLSFMLNSKPEKITTSSISRSGVQVRVSVQVGVRVS